MVGVDNDSDAATDADSAASDARLRPLVASEEEAEAEVEEDRDEEAEEPWRRRMSLDMRRTCCMAVVLEREHDRKIWRTNKYELTQFFLDT